jgi:SAM-dependent methyltransferase
MIFCGKELAIKDSDKAMSGNVLKSVGRSRKLVALPRLLPLLCDPATKESLIGNESVLQSSTGVYKIIDGSPHLYPIDLPKVLSTLASENFLAQYQLLSPTEQYFTLGALKAKMGTNLSIDDAWYQRHLWRSCELLADVRGTFLDVGCDDPLLSRGMLHEQVEYIGIEPSSSSNEGFCIRGFSEFLPLKSGVVDAVGFQTSLDHILDFRLALEEARRVLRANGRLYLATLLWTGERAQLHTDAVHFHHFRPSEIEAVLCGSFEIENVRAYSWKGDSHRCGVYLVAAKR